MMHGNGMGLIFDGKSRFHAARVSIKTTVGFIAQDP